MPPKPPWGTPLLPHTDLLLAQPLRHGAQLWWRVLYVGDGNLQETCVLLLRVPCRGKKKKNNHMPNHPNLRVFGV